jgi:hypothetical protein
VACRSGLGLVRQKLNAGPYGYVENRPGLHGGTFLFCVKSDPADRFAVIPEMPKALPGFF